MSLSRSMAASLHEWVDVFMFRSMQDLLQFLKESGLTIAHYSIFMRLYKGGPCGVSEIAEMLAVTKAAASQTVDKLMRQKLLARTEDAADRRFAHLTLTAKGRALTERCIDARTRWMNDLPLSAQQEQSVIFALRELTETARALQRTQAGQPRTRKPARKQPTKRPKR